ncbi:hypothetical protein ANCCAN_09488 [Ancylostoma caninum]|uniref:Uncharacterized protein n=1 Tax=Ancylostoma caninum TaxID=29170 RepID=A0A368GNJ9_ANCCA|nr:hypothetical protein ANCCAN_09488 [Ancylostoma caninum]
MKIYTSFVLFAAIFAMFSVPCAGRQYGKRPPPPPLIMPSPEQEFQQKRPRYDPPSPHSPPGSQPQSPGSQPQSPGIRTPGSPDVNGPQFTYPQTRMTFWG